MNRVATQIGFTLLLIAAFVPCACAQAGSDQNSGGAAPAATSVDTTTQMSENPPLSGLDQPTFEPGFGTRSYLAPKVELSEAVDSNGLGSFSSNSNITETTRALGSLDLQKLWKMHPFDLDYIGGVDWYTGANSRVYQLHSLAATQRFQWRTGQFALRDSFSYLPEGGFGFGSFGGAGAFGGGALGGGGIPGSAGPPSFSNVSFGTIGSQVTNMGIADVTQYLNPRSSVVLSALKTGCFFNSQEAVAQAGYNYQISRHDQVALVYAYEELHFPAASAGSLNLNMWQLEYGHRISGKLDFVLGGGPEWVHRSQSEEELLGMIPTGLPCLNTNALLPCVVIKSSFITGSAQASFRYHMSARTNLLLTYMRYISPGSGFFGGANTDLARFAVSHSLGRRWTMTLDTGYSSNSRLLGVTSGAAAGASKYHYWYVGAGAHRQLGRYFAAFASYQYNAFAFSSKGCTATSAACGQSYGRNIFLLGLNWTPQPIRLD